MRVHWVIICTLTLTLANTYHRTTSSSVIRRVLTDFGGQTQRVFMMVMREHPEGGETSVCAGEVTHDIEHSSNDRREHPEQKQNTQLKHIKNMSSINK